MKAMAFFLRPGRSHKVPIALLFFLLVPAVHLNAQVAAPEASSKPAKRSATHSATTEGTLKDGIYRNPYFGFSYKVPYGWVDRASDMSDGTGAGKAMVLLSTFERPPEATGEGVNSAVVIAAESVASYPGLKTAADYFGPLTELTTSKGFKVVNEPHDFSLDAKQLVRGDFSKELGSHEMQQSSLVVLAKGYVISFTFIAGNEDEVEELVGNLSFSAKK